MKHTIIHKKKPKKRKTRAQKIQTQKRLQKIRLENLKQILIENRSLIESKSEELKKPKKKINQTIPLSLALLATGTIAVFTNVLNPFAKTPIPKFAKREYHYENHSLVKGNPFFTNKNEEDNLKISYIISSTKEEDKYRNYGFSRIFYKDLNSIQKAIEENDEQQLLNLLKSSKLKKFYTDTAESLGFQMEGVLTDNDIKIIEYHYDSISKTTQLIYLCGLLTFVLTLGDVYILNVKENKRRKRLENELDELYSENRKIRKRLCNLKEDDL